MGRPRFAAHCRECGNECPRRGRWDHGYKCIDCSILASETAAAQIIAGEGEYYERWLRGLARSVERRLAKIDSGDRPPESAPPR